MLVLGRVAYLSFFRAPLSSRQLSAEPLKVSELRRTFMTLNASSLIDRACSYSSAKSVVFCSHRGSACCNRSLLQQKSYIFSFLFSRFLRSI